MTFPPLHHFATLPSTNDYLKQLADAPEFTCVTADAQTAGRGRYDRTWVSPAGEGLYLSVLLRPQAENQHLALISLLTAIAVAETLREQGIAGVDIKWPNDVLIAERKVCGILVEALSTSSTHQRAKPSDSVQSLRVIVGIGVNLNQSAFPSALADTATSVLLATGQRSDVNAFREQLLARLARWYRQWQSGAYAAILARWQALSSYAEGQAVTIHLPDEVVTGVTVGLTEAGALRVRVANGDVRTILSGEVQRTRKTPMNIG